MRALALAFAGLLLLGACGTNPPTIAPATVAPASAAPTAVPSVAASASPSASAPAGVVPVEDATLLAILPEAIDGVPVEQETIAFREAAADPGFASAVESAVFAVAVDGSDLASAVVAKPHPGTFNEGWYADWRATYDRGACSQAGGLAATAETELADDRTLYVGTCSGGLHTYHTWLPGKGVVVSAFGLGERRLGDQLMAGVRP